MVDGSIQFHELDRDETSLSICLRRHDSKRPWKRISLFILIKK